nr:alpha/beta fold hydrolase [Planosporangium mesophilum]
MILPGITSPAATADFLATELAELGFRVHVPDIRGRGRTDRAPAGEYRLTDYAADVAGLVDALGLNRPVVLGHSMGARIAIAYAVLHAGADHNLLILVDPPVCGPGRGPYPTTRESFLEQLHEAYRGTTADEVRRFYPKWPQRELQLRAEVLATCDETAVLETHAGFESEDIFGYWREVTQPAVLIRGGDSPVVPAASADDLRAANSRIEILTVPDAGHMVPWDNLPGFLDAARPYLQSAVTH